MEFRDPATELAQTYPDPLIDEAPVLAEAIDIQQFFAQERLNTGEKRLMFAVVEEAVSEFLRHARSSERRLRRRFLRTLDWFKAEDASWPFSFVNICQALEIDEDVIRMGLDKWRRKFAPESFEPLPPKPKRKYTRKPKIEAAT